MSYKKSSNYKCVELGKKGILNENDINENIKHSKINNIYKVGFKLETITPVSVGSGKYKVELQGNCVKQTYLIQRDSEGKPIIPASSVKGSLRFHYELLFGTKEAESLFGSSLPYMARFVASDMTTDNNNPINEVKIGRQWKPIKICKSEIGQYALSYKVYDANSFISGIEDIYIEAFKEGIVLKSYVMILNSTEYEIVKILASMGAQDYSFKLGRAKEKGMGRLKLKEVDVSLSNDGGINFSFIDSKSLLEKAKKLLNNKISERRNLSSAFIKV
jgi:CRISPR/Cas system CSM-associated protein Csm3 (group 7 of RAMP superfamily)